LVIDGHTVEV
jgi:hypothetical protein